MKPRVKGTAWGEWLIVWSAPDGSPGISITFGIRTWGQAIELALAGYQGLPKWDYGAVVNG